MHRMENTDSFDTHGFETPRARAYLEDFLADPTLDFIEDTFEYDADDLAEATDALLAAELVASLIGAPAAALPAPVRAACSASPNKKLLTRARAAVRSALASDAPLRQHWEVEGLEPWLSDVTDLLERLT